MSASPDLMMLESAARALHAEHGLSSRFIGVAHEMLKGVDRDSVVAALEKRFGASDARDFKKAAVTAQTFNEVWATGVPHDLATGWLWTLAPFSILDALRGRASSLPDIGRVLIASGAVANVAVEGAPKAATRVNLTLGDGAIIKTAGIVVFSEELARAADGGSMRLFEETLRDAVVSGTNKAVLDALPKTSIAATGTALGDLQAGIAAAGPSQSYVVAVNHATAGKLAFASDGRMGVAGGEAIPGVFVVPHAVAGVAPMIVIPASRVALNDFGLSVRSAGHASVQMDDAPTNPPVAATVLTSLWQNNLRGLLAERSFRIVSASNSIGVG